ncbi:hypothetical protein BX600DRAFT_441856 [Xylariales sp. PMI_506]|nr:hypothetical protein BX600DRAFT_441856 [Xylariales sp. PMI_506]
MADTGPEVNPKQGSPTVEQPNRSHLVALPRDILFQIFYSLYDASPESLGRLATLCSQFRQIARYVRYRDIYIDLRTNTRVGSDLLDAIPQDDLIPAVRMLRVCGPNLPRVLPGRRNNVSGDSSSSTSHELPFLRDAIRGMTGLRDLHWEGAYMPDTILGAVKQSPQLRLHVHFRNRYMGPTNALMPRFLTSLADCPNLFSIRVEVTYKGSKDCLEMTQPLKRILLSCPNVRALSLDFSQPRQGCVVYHVPHEYHGFGFADGEHPPALEELSIISYPWGTGVRRDAHSTSVPHGNIGYPGNGSEVDYWAENFNWSRLHRLQANEQILNTLGSKIAKKLIALEQVEVTPIRFMATESSIQDFLDDVPSSLQSLTIPSLSYVNIVSLARHAESLRRLYVHQNESYKTAWRDIAITAGELTMLRENLPNLEELELDIDRTLAVESQSDADWPWASLDILAGFRKLRSLKLWFELGIGNRSMLPQPRVNAESAVRLCSYLHQRQARSPFTGQPPLKRLHVCSGAPPPLGRGLPGHGAFWPRNNSTSFVCELSEHDDEAARGIFNVMCPDLSRELNVELRRILAGSQRSLSQNTGHVKLELALEGPKPLPSIHRLQPV